MKNVLLVRILVAVLCVAAVTTAVVGTLHYTEYIAPSKPTPDEPSSTVSEPISDTSGNESSGTSYEIDSDASGYVAPEISKELNAGISIPGWPSITIPANTQDVVVDFYNPDENGGSYYLMYELRIPNENGDGYETLYQSKLIPPGLHIQKIHLSRGLAAGSYDAIIHVQPITMDGQYTETNNADMKTQLIVK